MKQKWFVILMIIVLSIGLIACTSDKSVKTEKNDDVVEENQEPEKSKTNLEATTRVETETEIAEKEEVIQEESKISWYMDAEGIKSDELGIVIKKDNGIFEEIELIENVGIFTPSESSESKVLGSRHQAVFTCHYYDGEFDSYITENGMKKSVVNGIEYAYVEEMERISFAIGGKGIIVSSTLYSSDFKEGESVDDYLRRIDFIKPCDNFGLDCLAYITKEGLYCPILGISLSSVGTEHCINFNGISCSKGDYSALINMRDESIQGMGTMHYMTETNSAQEIVNKYVESLIEPSEYRTVEYVAIDGMVEVNLGKYNFVGRGLIGKYEWDEKKFEDWLFYSDDATWSISCSYDQTEGIDYKNWLKVFETLQ